MARVKTMMAKNKCRAMFMSKATKKNRFQAFLPSQKQLEKVGVRQAADAAARWACGQLKLRAVQWAATGSSMALRRSLQRGRLTYVSVSRVLLPCGCVHAVGCLRLRFAHDVAASASGLRHAHDAGAHLGTHNRRGWRALMLARLAGRRSRSGVSVPLHAMRHRLSFTD